MHVLVGLVFADCNSRLDDPLNLPKIAHTFNVMYFGKWGLMFDFERQIYLPREI